MKKKSFPPLTAIALKDTLWDTLNGVRDKSVHYAESEAIASQAREILRTVKMQILVCAHAQRTLPPDVIEFSG